MSNGTQLKVIEGDDDLEIVGESYYQDHLWLIVGGATRERVRHDAHAVLVPEHGNPYDDNAISAWINGLKVGHLSRSDAESHRDGLLMLQASYGTAIALAGVIAGGGVDDHGRARMLGVFLNYDRSEFGFAPSRLGSPESSDIHTGFSNAVSTDDEDDTYDLRWRTTLPAHPTARAARLHQLLDQETDAISRHFLFADLESTLYKLRDTSPSALNDYDAACRLHDGEMDEIVPALVAKFGAVPLLDTYRQAAIRHQKAKDFEKALWWTERGITFYGDRPAKPEMPQDLQRRAAKYRSKLFGSSR